MNTYPTTAEQLYLEQKIRDANNIDYFRENDMARREKLYPKTKQQKKNLDEIAKKWEEGIKAGYDSKRYDFPEYQWKMVQDGKTYLRSSCNNNVYDYSQSSVIVGIWNQETQRIEL